MNVVNYLRIAPFINDCPSCSNQMLGNGEGTLNVNNNIIKRTCKCGFNFEYDVKNGTSKTKVKKAIDESLKSMESLKVKECSHQNTFTYNHGYHKICEDCGKEL